MDYKRTKAESTTVTRNITQFENGTDNIYESLVIMAKRANQIGSSMKTELARLVKLGVLRRNSDSDWGSPSFIIPKKNNSWEHFQPNSILCTSK